MSNLIKTATLLNQGEILPGEIEGAKTFYHVCKPGETQALLPVVNEIQILFITSGMGRIYSGGKDFPVSELSLFIPSFKKAVTIQAEKTSLTIFEVRWQMVDEDLPILEAKKELLPYLINYSECKTYKEAIKSPKTINRTLVLENIVPRFCMGSVETEGPDSVGAHRHPMLEQHFFGLKGNDCLVKADSSETSFSENMLLHIPLGSEHSVQVAEGKNLHYLWLDFFRDQKSVEWIAKMHKSDE